jgi:hypothetical protein
VDRPVKPGDDEDFDAPIAQRSKSFLVLRVPMTVGEAEPSESGRSEKSKKNRFLT